MTYDRRDVDPTSGVYVDFTERDVVYPRLTRQSEGLMSWCVIWGESGRTRTPAWVAHMTDRASTSILDARDALTMDGPHRSVFASET